jgi:hypothetical protein
VLLAFANALGNLTTLYRGEGLKFLLQSGKTFCGEKRPRLRLVVQLHLVHLSFSKRVIMTRYPSRYTTNLNNLFVSFFSFV